MVNGKKGQKYSDDPVRFAGRIRLFARLEGLQYINKRKDEIRKKTEERKQKKSERRMAFGKYQKK